MDGKKRDAALARVALRQHGAFTRDQAARVGLTEDQIQRRVNEQWVELRSSVYALASTPRTKKLELSAVSLWCGPDGALSHHSAADLYRLDGRWGRDIHVITPRRRRLRKKPGLLVHRSDQYDPERDSRMRDGLRVTTLARTLIDLSGVLSEKWLEIALESALRDQRLDLGWVYRLIRELDPRGQRGLPVLVKLLDDRDQNKQRYASALEVLLARLKREYRLPEPDRQYVIVEENRYLLTADFAYPDLKVAVEGDGFRHHSGKRAWDRDSTNRRKLLVHGWDVLGISWSDVERDPSGVAADIAAVVKRKSRP